MALLSLSLPLSRVPVPVPGLRGVRVFAPHPHPRLRFEKYYNPLRVLIPFASGSATRNVLHASVPPVAILRILFHYGSEQKEGTYLISGAGEEGGVPRSNLGQSVTKAISSFSMLQGRDLGFRVVETGGARTCSIRGSTHRKPLGRRHSFSLAGAKPAPKKPAANRPPLSVYVLPWSLRQRAILIVILSQHRVLIQR